MPLDATRNTQHPVRKLVPLLLSWFSRHARDLPWRRTRDPYAIWVSEVMLQQTQVKTVIPYWERWMRELPSIESVASATPAKLHKLWEGLGYYTRVRNLQKAAQEIVARHNGSFPDNFDNMLALPGIGRYTAGAIASIAFNQPRPILDGNVNRILTRILGIATDPREKRTNARLWRLATELARQAARLKPSRSSRRKQACANRLSAAGCRLSSKSGLSLADTNQNACSHLNQSLMELGALICTPRSPNCAACPVRKYCVAFHEKRQRELPNLAKRQAATVRRFLAFIVERNSKFLIRQRPGGAVNAHMWEFPNVEVGARVSEPQQVRIAASSIGLRLADSEPLCVIKHSITRYRITLEAYCAKPTNFRLTPIGSWFNLPQLHQLAFTSAHKQVLAHVGTPNIASARCSVIR